MPRSAATRRWRSRKPISIPPRPRAQWRYSAKYGDTVRVLTMGGGFSVELCGGTHVNRTGDIGLFKITSEGGVAAGVRRIEAVTGAPALAYLNDAEEQLKQAASLVKGSRENLLDKLGGLLERNRQLEKELEQLSTRPPALQVMTWRHRRLR